jgi:hypothetical protein
MPDLKVAAAKGNVEVLATDNGELLIFKLDANGNRTGNPGLVLRDHGSGAEIVRYPDPGSGWKLADDGKVHVYGLTTQA